MTVPEFRPLDVLATGEIKAGRVEKVIGLRVKQALAARLRCRLFVTPAQPELFPSPDDLKVLAGPVLEHRLLLTPEAQLEGSDSGEVLEDILETVPVPTARGGR